MLLCHNCGTDSQMSKRLVNETPLCIHFESWSAKRAAANSSDNLKLTESNFIIKAHLLHKYAQTVATALHIP